MSELNDLTRVRTPEAWKTHLIQAVEAENHSLSKKNARRVRSGLLIVAVVAVLGVGITAVASNVWNNSGKGYHRAMYKITDQAVVYENGEPAEIITEPLEDAVEREYDSEHPVIHIGEYRPYDNLTELPFMLDENDPQYEAMVEWNEALLKPDPYDQDPGLAELFGPKYPAYLAHSPQKQQDLEEIAGKYDLELVTWQVGNSQTLADEITAMGLTNLPVKEAVGYNGFVYCSDGSFWYDAPVDNIGQPEENSHVRVWHLSRTTMPMEYWTVNLNSDTSVTTFTVGEREGYVYRTTHGVTFLMRFDDTYAVASFGVGRAIFSDPEDWTVLTDEDVQTLCKAINWGKFEDLGLKGNKVYLDAAALYAERLPKSTSPDPDHPFYGTFKDEILGTVYEYYPDHFSCDGVRYDGPEYSVTGTYDILGTGKFIYTTIDADCGDGVHFTIITYAKSPDHLGVLESAVTIDAANMEIVRTYMNSRRQ